MDLNQDLIDQMLSGGTQGEPEGGPWSDEQLQAEIDAARLAAGMLSNDDDPPAPASGPASGRPAHAAPAVGMARVPAAVGAGGGIDAYAGSPPVPATPVHPVQFMPLSPEAPSPNGGHGIDLLLDVQLEVSVELGRSHMNIRDVLALRGGSLIELDKLAGEPVDVSVNGTLIARGEVVVVDEKFGVRITEVVSKARRLGVLS